LLAAIDGALAMTIEDRPQSVEAWRAMLAGDAAPPVLASEPVSGREPLRAAPAPLSPAPAAKLQPSPAQKWTRIAAYALGIVGIGIGAILLYEAFRAWRGMG
jgi:hypothetical protein